MNGHYNCNKIRVSGCYGGRCPNLWRRRSGRPQRFRTVRFRLDGSDDTVDGLAHSGAGNILCWSAVPLMGAVVRKRYLELLLTGKLIDADTARGGL